MASDLFHLDRDELGKLSRERAASRDKPAAGGTPRAIEGLAHPLAHRCFRCDDFTPLGVRAGNGIIWACKDHIGALQ